MAYLAHTKWFWTGPNGHVNIKTFWHGPNVLWSFRGGSVVKNSPPNAGDAGLIPGLGRFPGEGNGNSLQYSCQVYPKAREAWGATIRGDAKESDMT